MGNGTTAYVADPDSAPMTSQDWDLLAGVEASLACGLEVQRWWQKQTEEWPQILDKTATESILSSEPFQESFQMVDFSENWPKDVSFGFFDEVPLGVRNLPVRGCFQQVFYDRPALRVAAALEKEVKGISKQAIAKVRGSALDEWCDKLGKFALGTFIRVTGQLRPHPPAEAGKAPIADYLKFLSRCPTGQGKRTGTTHSQVYYKRQGKGRIGKFWPKDQPQINLRAVQEGEFEWIVLKVRASGNDLKFRIAEDAPYLGVPADDLQYGVVSPELIVDDERAADGVRGRYGFGYTLLEGPQKAYGATGDAGLKQIEFWVEEDGAIRVKSLLLAARPERISTLHVNPVELGYQLTDRLSLGLLSPLLRPVSQTLGRLPVLGGFDPILSYVALANAATGGFAGKELCISQHQLDRELLFKHYLKTFDMLVGTRGTWRTYDPQREIQGGKA